MKRAFSVRLTAALALSLLPALAFAVDTTSEAYKKGHAAGKVMGYIVLGVVVFAVLRKFFKK